MMKGFFYPLLDCMFGRSLWCTRRKWPKRLVAKTSCRPSELRRSCWVKRPSAVANMLMTFLQWECTLLHNGMDNGQAALVHSYGALSQYEIKMKKTQRKTNKELTLDFYLENRPLKKALTSTCGLGIIPAFRYRKSILLYLWKNTSMHQRWINLNSQLIVQVMKPCSEGYKGLQKQCTSSVMISV